MTNGDYRDPLVVSGDRRARFTPPRTHRWATPWLTTMSLTCDHWKSLHHPVDEAMLVVWNGEIALGDQILSVVKCHTKPDDV
jgi:hypothetical protein